MYFLLSVRVFFFDQNRNVTCNIMTRINSVRASGVTKITTKIIIIVISKNL